MANPSVNKVTVGKTKVFSLLANVEQTLVFDSYVNLVNITNLTTNTVYFRTDNELSIVADPECNLLNQELLSVNRIATSNFREISFITDTDSTIQIFNAR